eukprot:IDg21253t1
MDMITHLRILFKNSAHWTHYAHFEKPDQSLRNLSNLRNLCNLCTVRTTVAIYASESFPLLRSAPDLLSERPRALRRADQVDLSKINSSEVKTSPVLAFKEVIDIPPNAAPELPEPLPKKRNFITA